jgi:hypothetical protein
MTAAGNSLRARMVAGGIDPVVVGSKLFDLSAIGQVVVTSELIRAAAECSPISLHRNPEDFPTHSDFTSLLRFRNRRQTKSQLRKPVVHVR